MEIFYGPKSMTHEIKTLIMTSLCHKPVLLFFSYKLTKS